MSTNGNQQPKNITPKKICTGCGLGCLGMIGIVVIAFIILYSSTAVNMFKINFVGRENLSYKGQKVVQIADQQGLPATENNIAPKTNGVYKNPTIGMGLRFKTKFGKYDLGDGKVDLVLLSDESKCLHFKVVACGESLYDIIDNKGKRWGFASVINDGKELMLIDQGKHTFFKFNKDPRKRKKK